MLRVRTRNRLQLHAEAVRIAVAHSQPAAHTAVIPTPQIAAHGESAGRWQARRVAALALIDDAVALKIVGIELKIYRPACRT